MFFDPRYLLYVGPAMLLALWAQYKVKSTFAMASQIAPASRLAGAEVAERILEANGLERTVGIEATPGALSDHYDPRSKTLRLSPDVYNGRSLAALGVAAHEVGHALQDAKRYPLLGLRNAIVPLASFGSSGAFILLGLGFALASVQLVVFGIALFSFVVLFQLVNLPVEFDASRRANKILLARGYITPAEAPIVKQVLSAAAMTYVAATLTSILTLVYYLSLVRGRNE